MANNNKQPLIASVVVAAVLCLLLGVSGEDSPAPAGGPAGGESILDAAADVGGNGGPMACMGKLGPCEKFLSEPSSEPSPECCTPMKEVVTKEKVCLCTLFKNAELLKSVNMTQDNALGIAKKCGADADPSICKDVAIPPSANLAAQSQSSTTNTPSGSGAINGRQLASPSALFLVLFSFLGLM
nr:protein YLS3-like isoform X2 [Ipomoea batatas]